MTTRSPSSSPENNLILPSSSSSLSLSTSRKRRRVSPRELPHGDDHEDVAAVAAPFAGTFSSSPSSFIASSFSTPSSSPLSSLSLSPLSQRPYSPKNHDNRTSRTLFPYNHHNHIYNNKRKRVWWSMRLLLAAWLTCWWPRWTSTTITKKREELSTLSTLNPVEMKANTKLNKVKVGHQQRIVLDNTKLEVKVDHTQNDPSTRRHQSEDHPEQERLLQTYDPTKHPVVPPQWQHHNSPLTVVYFSRPTATTTSWLKEGLEASRSVHLVRANSTLLTRMPNVVVYLVDWASYNYDCHLWQWDWFSHQQTQTNAHHSHHYSGHRNGHQKHHNQSKHSHHNHSQHHHDKHYNHSHQHHSHHNHSHHTHHRRLSVADQATDTWWSLVFWDARDRPGPPVTCPLMVEDDHPVTVRHVQQTIVAGRYFDFDRQWVEPGHVLPQSTTPTTLYAPLPLATSFVQALWNRQQEQALQQNTTTPRLLFPTHARNSVDVTIVASAAQTKKRRVGMAESYSHYSFLARTVHTLLKEWTNATQRRLRSISWTNETKAVATMTRSKMVVLVQPDEYESNTDLWPALASGALVLMDEHLAPPGGLLNGTHVVTFSSWAMLKQQLEYYSTHDHERTKIARAGWQRALQQRPWHVVEQVLFGKPQTTGVEKDVVALS